MSNENYSTFGDLEHTEFRAPRTGDTTLTGRGRLLAETNNDPESKSQKDDRFRRWHNLRVWETVGGNYVLHIAFRTHMIHEREFDTSKVFGTLAEALFFARDVYVPLKLAKVMVTKEDDPKHEKFTWIISRYKEQYKDAANQLAVMAHKASGIGNQETNIE